MTVLLSTMHSLTGTLLHFLSRPVFAAALACALLPSLVTAQSGATADELQALSEERRILTGQLEQYQKTLDLLQTDGTPPQRSNNPAVRELALEMAAIKERLLAITEREVTLLREQLLAASEEVALDAPTADTVPIEPAASQAIESKPLRTMNSDDTVAREAENVERLHGLLANYYNEMENSARTAPSEAEIAQREAAGVDAQKLAKMPFSIDKIRLNGAEGSTALSQISQRLTDPTLAESRRDIAPICSIKRYLFGALVGSDNRSLKPVGKNHFVARVRLQPGDTTLRIHNHRWEVRLPQSVSATDFLITLYSPPGSSPELHIFAIDDLLAEEDPHIPAWLPDDLKIKPRAG